MSITTTTHLNFRGQARDALDFYAAVFGGEVMAFTFAQGGDERDTADGAAAEQIKWGRVRAANGFSIMAFDVPPKRAYDAGTDAVYVSVRGSDTEEIARVLGRPHRRRHGAGGAGPGGLRAAVRNGHRPLRRDLGP